MNKELLAFRARKNKKKPAFNRTDIYKKIKLRNKNRWRKPRGKQSKIRLQKGGHQAMPSPGWGSPKEVKGFHKSGLRPVVVHAITDLEKLKKGEDGAIIGKSVGNFKRLELIKKLEEKGIRILNIKDPKKFVEDVKKELEERKKQKTTREAEKSKKNAKPKKEEKKKEV